MRARRRCKAPWGEPFCAGPLGTIAGLPIVFLPRHDKGHRLSPSDINYRANIDVLKRAGATDLVSLSPAGRSGRNCRPVALKTTADGPPSRAAILRRPCDEPITLKSR